MLHLLLLGKTGNGKSATGNLLLDRNIFKTSSYTTSKTNDVKSGVAEFGSYKLNIVDGSGVVDTYLYRVWDKEAAMTNVEKALALCYGGVDAFLFLLRFGNRFTAEDRLAIEGLKQIFGGSFMEHVIILVTGGDMFESYMEDEGCGYTIDQWWKNQSGPFREFCNDCKGRVLLVNNHEKDTLKRHKQVEQIVHLAYALRNNHGRYTSSFFETADVKRDRLIIEQKAPILKKEFQEKICLLSIEILIFAKESSNRNKSKLQVRIQELRNEIEKHDKGIAVLIELSMQINKLENCLQDTIQLKEIAENLEDVRNAKYTWQYFGQNMAKLGVRLGGNPIMAGFALSALSGIPDVTASVILTSKETKQTDEIAAAGQKLRKLEFGQEHGEPSSQDVKKKRTNIAETQLEKDMDKLNYLLLGRTRHGKSSTGNTILNRDVFPTATCEAPVTRDVQCFSGEFGRFLIRVVDGPGIINTIMTYAESVASSVQNMNTALGLCFGSVDAFLFVIKLGERTAEDRKELEYLKIIFGDSFLDHIILVITHGDLFPGAMEGCRHDVVLHDWCSQQDEDFRQLFDGCCGRVLLFNKMEIDEDNARTLKQKLVQHTQDIINRHGRYTTEMFELARVDRERLILELRAPQIRLEFQGKIQKLAARLEQLSQHPTHTEGEIIRELVEGLRRELNAQDAGHGVLADLLGQVENMGKHLDEIPKRHNLDKDGKGLTDPPTL